MFSSIEQFLIYRHFVVGFIIYLSHEKKVILISVEFRMNESNLNFKQYGIILL